MPPEGDPFLQAIEENKALIFKICSAYCRSSADRDDLAQEIIITLWKGRSRYRPEFKFSTWLYRVALNVAISHYRKNKKLLQVVPLSETHHEQSGHPTDTDAQEQQLLLQREISALKELDKALMILYLEDRSYKEIAEIMGISETNVATKLSRIKEKIKQKLTNNKIN